MDEITRRLKVLEQQQVSFAENFRRIAAEAPLVFAAVGLIAGVFIENYLGFPKWLWLVLLVLFAGVGFGLFTHKATRYRYEILAFVAAACFLCLGGIRLINYQTPQADDIRHSIDNERTLASVRGIVLTRPYFDKQNWEFARFSHSDPDSSFYLRLKQVKTTEGWASAGGIVRVQVCEPVIDLAVGDFVELYCWLYGFGHARNPGQFDTAKYLARRGVFIGACIKSRDAIEPLQSKQTGFFLQIRERVRLAISTALLNDTETQQQSAGLLEALLLGFRGNIDNEAYRAFEKTGLLHFISLSGLHLGILIGTIWLFCQVVGLSKVWRAVVCIASVGLFLMVVPARAPTVRAAIIVVIFCSAFFFRRRPNSYNSLALAAILLLLVRPTNLFEPGWQLSFAAVLGILLFSSRIQNLLYRLTSLQYEQIVKINNTAVRASKKSARAIISLFSVGVAAWLGGAGIILYHFYSINPMAALWTVLAFPLVAAILILGLVKVVMFFLVPSLSVVLAVVLSSLSGLLVDLVRFLAAIDKSTLIVGFVPVALIIFYYGLLGIAAFMHLRRPVVKRIFCGMLLVFLIAFFGATKRRFVRQNDLSLTVLDVGHGQAIVAAFPDGKNIIFDAGSLSNKDIGRRVVAAFLKYEGISKIDAAVISHNDIDHLNGLPEIASAVKISKTYANRAFFESADEWNVAKALKQSLAKKNMKIELLPQELNSGREAKISILWPTEQALQNNELNENNKSAVILIEFADKKVLLCSDIEKPAQRQLLEVYPKLKADAIIVPHHGSANTLDKDFITRLGAQIAICSCGKSQYQSEQIFKPPSGIDTFYTPEHGAITLIISDEGKIEIRSFVKRKQPS